MLEFTSRLNNYDLHIRYFKKATILGKCKLYYIMTFAAKTEYEQEPERVNRTIFQSREGAFLKIMKSQENFLIMEPTNCELRRQILEVRAYQQTTDMLE